MKLTKYEKLMLYIIGFLDFLETVFIKHFYIGVFACLFFYFYNLAGGSDQGKVSPSESVSHIVTAFVICGVLYLFYKNLKYKNRIRNGKRRKR